MPLPMTAEERLAEIEAMNAQVHAMVAETLARERWRQQYPRKALWSAFGLPAACAAVSVTWGVMAVRLLAG